MSIASRLALLASRGEAFGRPVQSGVSVGAPARVSAGSDAGPGFVAHEQRPRVGAHVAVGTGADLRGRLARLVPRTASIVRPPVAFDLETTGIGRDAVPFLVGLAGVGDDGAPWLVQWELGDRDGERVMWISMIETLRSLGSETPLVTYNGASFDRPIVRTRLRRLGLWDDALDAWFGPRHHDLLPVCRRLWRGALPDVRLVTLERMVLGATRHDDPDGAAIAALGEAWLDGARGDAIAADMAAIRRHNAWDLDGLLALIPAAAAVIEAPRDLATAVRVATHLVRVGDLEAFETICESWSDAARRDRVHGPELLLRWAEHLRRRGDHPRAHELLHAVCAVDPRSAEARTRLAIDYEHRLRRPDLALAAIEGSITACPVRIARLQRRVALASSPTAVQAVPGGAPPTSPGPPTVAASPVPAPIAVPTTFAVPAVIAGPVGAVDAASRPRAVTVPGTWRAAPSGARRPLV